MAGAGLLMLLAAASYLVFIHTHEGREWDAWGLAARLRQQEIGQLLADRFVAYLGMLAVLLALLVAVACARRIRDALAMVALVVAPVGIAQVAKDVLGRPDPVPAELAASWPSGHVAVASVAAVVALAYAGNSTWARRNAVFLVGGMTTLTLILGWHRISDAIGALCIVGAVALLTVVPRDGRRVRLAGTSLAVLAAGTAATMAVLLGAAAVLFTNDGAWHLPHAAQVVALVPLSFLMAFVLVRLTLVLSGRGAWVPTRGVRPVGSRG